MIVALAFANSNMVESELVKSWSTGFHFICVFV